MKGMMFTELLEWVENTWSPEVADDVVDACELPSGGAYTAVGTYDFREMVALIGALAERVEQPADALVKRFGADLFEVLARSHPNVMSDATSAFQVLSRLDDHIHPEVRKLYPDAEVPSFDATAHEQHLQLVYRSSRPFADLAEGLILGCAAWFDESIDLERTDHDGATSFLLKRAHGG